MTIRAKISLLLSLALLALAVISEVGLFGMGGAQERFERLQDHTFPGLKALANAERAVLNISMLLHKHVWHPFQLQKAEDEKEINSALQEFDKAMAVYESRLVSDSTDHIMLMTDKKICLSIELPCKIFWLSRAPTIRRRQPLCWVPDY